MAADSTGLDGLATSVRAGTTRALLDVIHELYVPRPLRQLQRQILQLLLELVPANSAFYCENDIRGRRARWFNDRPDPTLSQRVPVLEEHMHEHPLYDYYLRTGDGRAHRISDLILPSQFQRSTLYDAFYRPQRIKHQMLFWVPHPTFQVAIGLDRHDRDFTDRERALLHLLRPHLIQALSNAAQLDALRRTRLSPRPQRNSQSLAPDAAHEALHAAGLTAREAEVLLWVARGKTNPEIGIILSASPRTIQKHLERIFQKLGVETRTCAAMRVAELLGTAAV